MNILKTDTTQLEPPAMSTELFTPTVTFMPPLLAARLRILHAELGCQNANYELSCARYELARVEYETVRTQLSPVNIQPDATLESGSADGQRAQ